MSRMKDLLEERFQHQVEVPADLAGNPLLTLMSGHASGRRFKPEGVPVSLLRALAAVALSSPTKSDLQQRDIVLVTDPALLDALKALVAGQAWTAGIPSMVVFCGNNRRQRRLHEATGLPFANDHLDAFFNATVDAAIALSSFVTAAEAAGLACCPISAIRNAPREVDRLLDLPDHVFAVAGLAVGWGEEPSPISQRLPLAATVHENRFSDAGFDEHRVAYDVSRAARQPYSRQRRTAELGVSYSYCWSEDRARQYGVPERAGFGAYIRGKGFRLD
jgi:nitroreductase